MGGGISSIVDLAILSTSITVQVNLYDGVGGWKTDIYCAAFKYPDPFPDGFMWDSFTTVQKTPTSDGAGSYVMPVIEFDASGAPIQPDTKYVVKCGIIADFLGKWLLWTKVRTPPAPPTCETGAKLDGMQLGPLLMDGSPDECLNIGGVEWFNFPKSMSGMHAYDTPHPVPAGSTIELTCCKGEECAFFFAIYKCEGCTGPRLAGLASTLVLDGWNTGSCSPQFDKEKNFKTTAFHKSVDATDGDITMTYNVPHDEILALFSLEGSIKEPWCVRNHGPAQGGGASCSLVCPDFFQQAVR